MRGILLTSVTVASILSGGVFGHGAEAMTLTSLSAARVAAADSARVQRIANVCGTNGCVRVQTQRVRHQKPGSVAANHI